MKNDRTNAPTFSRRPEHHEPGDLPEGMELGEYRVLGKIGQGGMGAVFAAIQPVIGKRAAIKVLAPHVASNPEAVRRFVDEARAANKIGHPNIVDIFSFGWLPDGRHYFVMELLEGQSLGARLREGGLPLPESRRILRQICEALEAAHRQGVVHRDLKPDNIWVAQPAHGDSFAKLLDFGIAKLVSDSDAASLHTQTGALMGTPLYMSPEQCRGENITAATDVYALGVVLYEMFAQRQPFSGAAAQLITHHLMTRPAPPSTFAAVSPALDRVILSCLEKDPALRPRSAAALGELLSEALADAEPARSGEREQAAVVARAEPVSGPRSPSTSTSTDSTDSTDSILPAPGSTSRSLLTPATHKKRWYLLGALVAAAVAGLAVASGSLRRSPSEPSPRLGPAAPSAASPAGASAPQLSTTSSPNVPSTRSPSGRARVVVTGVASARVLIDGQLVAEGVRQAEVAALRPDVPHQLRVEAEGRHPEERTFTVTEASAVTLEVTFPAMGGPTHSGPRRAPSPSAHSPARHRDGLVGEDIFNAP